MTNYGSWGHVYIRKVYLYVYIYYSFSLYIYGKEEKGEEREDYQRQEEEEKEVLIYGRQTQPAVAEDVCVFLFSFSPLMISLNKCNGVNNRIMIIYISTPQISYVLKFVFSFLYI